jgi:hypothetical protein
MRSPVGEVHRSTGAREECEQFLTPRAQWQTGERKLARHRTLIVAGGGEKREDAVSQIPCFGAREIAAVPSRGLSVVCQKSWVEGTSPHLDSLFSRLPMLIVLFSNRSECGKASQIQAYQLN